MKKNAWSKKVVSLMAALALFVSVFQIHTFKVNAASVGYSRFIDIISTTRSGNTVSIKYKIKEKVPTGASLVVGFSYPGCYRMSDVRTSVGSKTGTYTAKLTSISNAIINVYVRFTAKNYTSSKSLKQFHTFSTATKYHTVTQAQENLTTGITVAMGVGLTLYSPATSAGARVLKAAGVGFTVVTGFSYAPKKGDYWVIKPSFDLAKRQYITNVKIYKSKADYNKGSKPIKNTTNSFKIPG